MKTLENIVQTLIINGTFVDCPGLFSGKTGIAVFFFHYARQTVNELFHDYAIELIEEVQKQISVASSARYDTGIAGIGVGFEYFLQNGFLEADDSSIFDDFDARMYRAAMYEPYTDLSLESGFTGWGRYFICRLCGNLQKNYRLHEALTHIADKIAQKIQENTVSEYEKPDVFRFFHDLTALPVYTEKYCDLLRQCKKWKCICEPDIQKIFTNLDNLQRLYICQNYFHLNLKGEIEKEWEKWEKTDAMLIELGLLKGLSAKALLHLTRLNENNSSWLKLL